ncbi:MAG: recombinase family protein [Monoglobales bacterium]
MKDEYVIAKYLRLSSEDGDKAESESMTNQRRLIDNYIRKMFGDIKHRTVELIDDGYSGTNMDRPGMKKLLIMAETHTVDCIVVKDFSRFARDYIEVGRYVEQRFPELQIRFISINDGYDSIEHIGSAGSIDVALKNIIYTMYSMDLSEKIKSSRKVLYRQGKNIAPYAFYGYKKDPDDKHHIIIDEPAANVVKRLFEMSAHGCGATEIARRLNNEGILTPAQYKKRQYPKCGTWDRFEGYTKWTSSMVRGLLRDERYTGKYIGARNERVSVGSRKHRRRSEDDIAVIEHAHEPIVSDELYKAVQPIVHGGTRPRSDKGIMRGLIRCGGCGHSMAAYGVKNDNVKYYCPYKSYSEHNQCCKTSICDSELATMIIDIVQRELEKAADPEKADKAVKRELYEKITAAERLRCSIESNKKEKLSLYMRLAKGEYDENDFSEQIKELSSSIKENEMRLNALEASIKETKQLSFKDMLLRFKESAEDDRGLIRKLVNTVYVYEDKRIKIVWNFGDINHLIET